MRRLAILAAGLAALIASGAAANPVVGKPAPPFVGVTVAGKKVTLAELRGNVVVINLWATWCAPCREELPLLHNYLKARAKNGLRVIAVDVDSTTVPEDVLHDLQSKLAMPVVKAFAGDYLPVNRAIPTNFVIDRNGIVRYARASEFTLGSLNAILVPLLNERPTAGAPPQ